MNFEELKDWLCKMSNPSVHRSEWFDFKEHHTDTNNLGSAEDVIVIDDEKHIIKKRDKLQPDYDYEEYEISFDRHVWMKTQEIVTNDFLKIVKPYTKQQLQENLPKWIDEITTAHNSTSTTKYFKDKLNYIGSLLQLKKTLKGILDSLGNSSPPNTDLRPWVGKKWKELKDKGYSDNKTAKQIKKELKDAISISTIKRWCKGYTY
jgi:hypothetical protein